MLSNVQVPRTVIRSTEKEALMSNHPINLALRFLLEMAILAALAYWGWAEHHGLWRAVLAVGLPLAAALLWGTFRVPGDPKDAPVPVPGPVRLLLELVLFAAAVWFLAAADQPSAAAVLGVLVVLHYAASYDRVRWLLARR
jgi:hypothetical protein